ncbi:MAG TPA: hypothetical protein K8V11_12245 [Dietzia timorensis]|uniref:Uncharacterized protein n=1 Tax=Dietzia timorensis TaxID=499555 RepID=A0A921F4Z3_9ACTN|nr:hypothetical protein [Dietzia timorensis]HJE91766.1 hypothetical protein [Dietzia timorensis]
MDPARPNNKAASGTADTAAQPCVPAEVALDPERLDSLAGRLQDLAQSADAEQPGLRLIGPPTPAALAAAETPGSRSAATLAMERLARLCADFASGAALRERGMSLDRELAWLRRETSDIGALAARSVRSLVGVDEDGAAGVGAARADDSVAGGRPAA